MSWTVKHCKGRFDFARYYDTEKKYMGTSKLYWGIGFISDTPRGTLTIPSHKVNKFVDKIVYIVIKYVTLTHFVLACIAGTACITVSFSKG